MDFEVRKEKVLLGVGEKVHSLTRDQIIDDVALSERAKSRRGSLQLHVTGFASSSIVLIFNIRDFKIHYHWLVTG